jgi:cyanophycinase
MLAGGSPSPPEALAWWSSFAGGGDVVLLRTDPIDLYLDTFADEVADVDSIEILSIQSPEDAMLESVACRLEQAEAIFVLGGWQNTYVDNWSASPIPNLIEQAWARGAAIGGNSAGIAIMGQFVFGAHQGTIWSPEALADPYSPKITLDTDFLHMPLGGGILFDTHFHQRDRMGRSITFLARIIEAGWDEDPIGVAIDEDTALLVDGQGLAEVRGSGSVYVLRPPGPPQVCVPETPLHYEAVEVFSLVDGEQLWLPDGITDIAPLAVTAADGGLQPEDPY